MPKVDFGLGEAYNPCMPPRISSILVLVLIVAAGLLPLVIIDRTVGTGPLIQVPGTLPARLMTRAEQGAQALAGLVIKPAYMLISLVTILVLAGQPGADLQSLCYSQIAFLTGETFCAINFYMFRHESVLSEYLHSYGMVLAFAFLTFALLESMDRRVLGLSASRGACAALKLCGRCTRHEKSGCKVPAIARFTLPLLAILAAVPLMSEISPEAYAVRIFGFSYSYTRLAPYLLYEGRVLPWAAIVAFAIAFVPLLRIAQSNLPSITRLAASAGVGALGFSFFRVSLNALFASNLVWFEFWEEGTELLFVAAIFFLLWELRRSLLTATPVLDFLGWRLA